MAGSNRFPWGKIVLTLWLAIIGGFMLLVLYVWSVAENTANLYGDMPSLEKLENPKSELSSELWSADGVLLGKYFRENRSLIPYDSLAPNLVKALRATEDVRFEEHSGIDLRGIIRVAFKTILLGQDAGGGSTISQQLAKNLFSTRYDLSNGKLNTLPGLRTLIAKTKEWLLAVRIERNYTKKEIIALYLNTVDFGSNSFGIKTAARTFFNKEPNELAPEESAVLVGLLKAPTYYSPIYNPENSTGRRNTVLSQMKRYHFITQAEYDTLSAKPLVLDYSVENHNRGMATYFRSVVGNYMMKWSKEHGYDLWGDGLKIYTTLDSRMQTYAEEAVAEHMAKLQSHFDEHWKGRNPWVDENHKEIPNFVENNFSRSEQYYTLKSRYENNEDSIRFAMETPVPMRLFTWDGDVDTIISPVEAFKYYKKILHAGFMSMDPYTGHIKAWVGGIDHKYFKFDHVLQGKRQPGSTFKPFVYAAAIDLGYSPCFEIEDAPVTFQTGNPDKPIWTPQNYENTFSYEKMTLRQGLAESKNSIAAALMKKLGPQTVVDMAKRLGITSHLEPVPALALGVSDVSVYELVGAYAAFVNQGIWTEPFYITRIEDKDGNLLQQFVPKRVEALNEETAFLMLHMLMGGAQMRNGTSLGLYRWDLLRGNEIAAKTGTTSNYSDGWYVGITKDLVSGAWVGGENRSIHFRSGTYGQGSRMAMPIWGLYMKKLYDDSTLNITRGAFERPERPLSVEINCNRYQLQQVMGDTSSSSDVYRPPTTDTDF